MGIPTARRWYLIILWSILLCQTAYAAAIQGKEEGSHVAYCKSIDFVGSSVTLTNSGLDCTMTDSGSGTGDVSAVGDCATGACFTGTSGTILTFKGATSGTTTLAPTAVAGTTALTLPAETGTVCSTGSVCSGYQASGSYATQATTITIAGTANEISSSAGAQDLSANRTWTLSVPSPFSLASKEFIPPNGTAFPVSPTANEIFMITDDSSIGACDSGAGSAVSLCYYTGSAWASVGDGTGSSTAWDNIGDAGSAGTIAWTGYQQIITSTLNSAGANLTMTNTTADLTADVSFIDMKYTDDGDVNGYYMRGYDNAAADLKWSIGADGAFTGKSFTAAASATPSTTFVDSDTTDNDTSAQIVTNCTDTGSGTEDCDITISSQTAGAMTARITIDGDGGIALVGATTIDAVAVPTISSTSTLTNKRITKRTGTTASSATPTINTDDYDRYTITALAANITSFTTNLSGTPSDGDKLEIRILDDGTARTIAWGASFRSIVTLPTTTTISKTLYVGFEWNSASSTWDCLAVAEQP